MQAGLVSCYKQTCCEMFEGIIENGTRDNQVEVKVARYRNAFAAKRLGRDFALRGRDVHLPEDKTE